MVMHFLFVYSMNWWSVDYLADLIDLLYFLTYGSEQQPKLVGKLTTRLPQLLRAVSISSWPPSGIVLSLSTQSACRWKAIKYKNSVWVPITMENIFRIWAKFLLKAHLQLSDLVIELLATRCEPTTYWPMKPHTIRLPCTRSQPANK